MGRRISSFCQLRVPSTRKTALCLGTWARQKLETRISRTKAACAKNHRLLRRRGCRHDGSTNPPKPAGGRTIPRAARPTAIRTKSRRHSSDTSVSASPARCGRVLDKQNGRWVASRSPLKNHQETTHDSHSANSGVRPYEQ